MIGKLTGIVDEIFSDHLIIDVKSVGYVVFCGTNMLQNLTIGSEAKIYIDTYVREDQLKLFGFGSIAEKQFFLLLKSVKGVGSKIALQIIAQLNISEISHAIYTHNTAILSSVSGVGKKMAERIITELKDKVSHCLSAKHEATSADSTSRKTNNHAEHQDAIMALVNLGISKNEATRRIKTIIDNDPDVSIDALITKALQAA